MRGFVVCVAAVATIGGCEFKCSTGGFSSKKVEKKIEASLAEQGVTVKATCPKIEKNSTTNCTAKTSDGKTVVIEVKATGKKANFETKNIVLGKKLEPMISSHYKAKYQLDFDSVTCDTVMIAGEPGTCTAMSQGVKVQFKVSGTGSNARYDPVAGLLVGDKAAALIQKGFGGAAKVDCGFKLKVSKPGARFTCNALMPDGKKQVVHVKITDADGGITTALTPPE